MTYQLYRHFDSADVLLYVGVSLCCICRGNWRLIVKECRDLLGKKYRDRDGKKWTFYGVVHGDDDYYYGMYRKGKCQLLSCVGSIEGFGFELISPDEAAVLDNAKAE